MYLISISDFFLFLFQTCVAPDYLLCHPDVQEELIKRFKETLFDFYGEVSKGYSVIHS